MDSDCECNELTEQQLYEKEMVQPIHRIIGRKRKRSKPKNKTI